MKKSCISSYTGKERSCYETLRKAEDSADYLRRTKGLNFYPYKCNECGYYHLALQEEKINFVENGCSCRDSNGNSKNLYATYADAVKAKEKAESKRDVVLEIYRCPECNGWHLTHVDYVFNTNSPYTDNERWFLADKYQQNKDVYGRRTTHNSSNKLGLTHVQEVSSRQNSRKKAVSVKRKKIAGFVGAVFAGIAIMIAIGLIISIL